MIKFFGIKVIGDPEATGTDPLKNLRNKLIK